MDNRLPHRQALVFQAARLLVRFGDKQHWNIPGELYSHHSCTRYFLLQLETCQLQIFSDDSSIVDSIIDDKEDENKELSRTLWDGVTETPCSSTLG